MKLDKRFAPCSVADSDEMFPNGIFVFNITRLVDYIKDHENEFTLEEIEVDNIRKSPSPNLNEQTVESANLKSPIILAEISPGRFNVIDGHHRLERAFRDKVQKLPVYRVNAFQHLPFLTSVKAY